MSLKARKRYRPESKPGGRENQSGAALIVTLAAILLMSGLILAFFLRSAQQRALGFSNLNQTKAEVLARQSLSLVIGAFKNEASLPSRSDVYDRNGVLNGSGGAPYLYLPKKTAEGRASMLPERIAPDGSPVTVLKLLEKADPSEAASSSFFSQGPQMTSDVSTGEPSLNGRKLDLNFWQSNKRGPRLGSLGATQPPGWCLVTKGNGNKSFTAWSDNLKNPLNEDWVIGRFAFICYDVGGLININQAGYPDQFSDGTSLDSKESSRKGPLSMLQLGNLPGLESVPASKLNSLLLWRTPEAFANKDIFLNLLIFNELISEFGWLSLKKGSNQFLSRSELIRYAQVMGIESALPYLTVFNRQSGRPSWGPYNPQPADITSPETNLPFDYETQALSERSTALARRVANTPTSGGPTANSVICPVYNRHTGLARWPTDSTLRTWTWDKTSNRIRSYQVKAGEPLILRRFPLSKIGLFEKYRNATGSEKTRYQAEILAAFGLIPRDLLTGSNLESYVEWVYAFPAYSGNAVSNNITRIMSLDELANVGNPVGVTYGISSGFNLTVDGVDARFNREPNFFELIMTGILDAEMGEGPLNTNPAVPNIDKQRLAQTEDLRRAAAMALRIGANIIDQYDSDSYPTIIAFMRNPTLAASSYSASPNSANYVQVVAGQENLPGISEIFFRNYRTGGTGNAYKSWFEFELWNPHQNAGEVTLGSEAPVNYRVVATAGTVSTGAHYGPLPNEYLGIRSDQNEADYSGSYASDAENTPHQIRFQYPESSTFRDPTILRGHLSSVTNRNPLGNEGSGGYQDTICGIFAGETVNAPHQAPAPVGPPNSLASYPYLDQTYSDTPNPPTRPIPNRIQRSITFWASSNSAPTFELQYQDSRTGAGNRWVPIQALSIDRDPVSTALISGFVSRSQDQYTTSSSAFYESTTLPEYTGATETFSQIRSILYGSHKIDPRLARPVTAAVATATPESSIRPHASPTRRGISFYQSPRASTDGGKIVNTTTSGMNYRYAGDFFDNRSNWIGINGGTSTSYILFFGRDGVLRPGDGWIEENSHPGMNITGAYYSNGIVAKTNYGETWLDHRPYFLNRPFRSVGELAYVHRDKPWKSINFNDPLSAEAGLLDLFCIQETPISQPVTTDGMNLNSMPVEVISALLQGAGRNPNDNTNGALPLDKSSADALAKNLRDFLDNPSANTGLFISRADLVTRFGRGIQNTANATHPAAKIQREMMARSLSEVGDTRTWNLLIDLVAQTGRYPSSAKGLADFVVEGEQRYWLHVALDRFTGEIIDQQLEAATE